MLTIALVTDDEISGGWLLASLSFFPTSFPATFPNIPCLSKNVKWKKKSNKVKICYVGLAVREEFFKNFT